jgi:uncharacterized repeat protein (TIGR01451 family)
VILAAGICGPAGYYVTRQPLEWMVAQDGVGQIVAVGHESPRDVSFLLRNSPQKVATNYARAHTSTISQILDRGTPSPADNVALDKGQSWISLTSPTEGTSHVVVWAPKEQNWDRRTTTATIYWVDAAWRFPPPVTVRAGARPDNRADALKRRGRSAAGSCGTKCSKVRRRRLAEREAAIEVRTDGAGRAIAQLLPGSMEPGITAVKVQIIRPGTSRGDLPQMIVGQGITTVQWTTPGLALRALGSSQVAADGAIGYRVEVTNNGDLVTRGVELSFTPPAGMTVLNSTPTAGLWSTVGLEAGRLPPRTTSVVELNCRATQAGLDPQHVRRHKRRSSKAEHVVVTEVRVNALSVTMNGPETVEVGATTSSSLMSPIPAMPLTNVHGHRRFRSGPRAYRRRAQPAGVARRPPLSRDRPGSFAVSFNVTQAGRQCHRLDVTADGGHAAARGCVTGISPVAAAGSVSDCPATPPAGEVPILIEVRNSALRPRRTSIWRSTGVSTQFERGSAGWNRRAGLTRGG